MDFFLQLPRPTKTYHTKPYAAISPSRPELSLKGKNVLITGGGSGIGLAMSNALAQAGAASIGIMARREKQILDAKASIEAKFPSTKVGVHVASLTSQADIDRVLAAAGKIDILILCASSSQKSSPTALIPIEELKTDFDTNVIGNAQLVKAFIAKPAEAERTIIHVTSAGSYLEMFGLAGYGASKAAMSHIIRNIANDFKEHAGTPKGIRAFTFHPAVAFTEMSADSLGLTEDMFEFDDKDLPGQFAVWLCSPEADFLNGRFVWAHWDVEELKAKKEKIENDPFALKLTLNVGGLTD